MFAASGAFLLGFAGVFIFGVGAFFARRRPYFLWPLGILSVLFAILAVWGWTR
jgi:uncharacterized membrane protein